VELKAKQEEKRARKNASLHAREQATLDARAVQHAAQARAPPTRWRRTNCCAAAVWC
jgi:hypothetical protein